MAAQNKKVAAKAPADRLLPAPVTVADEYQSAILAELKAIRTALEKR
jgi:hypothetical protein